MRRFVSILVVSGAVTAAFVLSGASSDSDGGSTTYKIQFDNAFGLVEGGDFRIGGVRAGQTSGFEIAKADGRTVAEVEAEVTEDGFDDLRQDASCEIKPQSLIGEYFVDCQPGSAAALPKDGSAVIPVKQNFSTIPQDLVNNIMRRPYRERLRLILSELGTGLAGRPEDVAEVLERAHPGLRETSRVLRILGDQNRVIERFIVDSDTVVNELEQNKKDVARWVTASRRASEVSASRSAEISQTFNKLPGFLDELTPTMRSLGNAADEQTPLLIDLKKSASDLNDFFTLLGPFSEASLPAVRALGRSSKAGTKAFQAGDEELDELLALSKDAPGFAKPLRQFLETMDSRERALEDDPRAKASAPPSPDPTAIPDDANFRGLAPKGGFTGLEAIWNYAYWQTLSINMFDSVGHIVRLGLTAVPDCSRLYNKPPETPDEEAIFEKCNQWIGANQPGINAPDFTIDGAGANAETSQRDAQAKADGRVQQRFPGEPEAPRIPGKPDYSEPNVTLPPYLQELLKTLSPEQLQGALDQNLPTPDGQSPEALLDYLLAP